ncbi:hypothetical protein [Salinibacter ruber]|uniref:hypothetical protein n=1 Tax=Salinibacter ruber TaxID=146919 RepID=UPI002073AE8F|nr:hypothetical protein [Salinibacter ruber]
MRSEIRHLLLRRRAFEKAKRREEIHLIGIRNEIRAALGSDNLIEDPYSAAPAAQEEDEEELQAFKYRMLEKGIVEWDEDLTTS